MRAEKNLAFKTAQDAGKKVMILSVIMLSSLWYFILFLEGGGEREAAVKLGCCAVSCSAVT